MKTTDYQFRPRQWPPPRDRERKDCYLFGFDEDNQPYILRYDRDESSWIAVSLDEEHNETDVVTITGNLVSKIVTTWADAPLLKRVLRKEAA
jgi:hypothetical protein